MRILFLIICFICFCQFGYSQTGIKTNANNDTILFSNDFFDQNKALELNLEFDIKTFTAEKSDEVYLPAILTYYIDDTVEISRSVKIKARGKVRKDYCYFPPYFLNIKNTDLLDDSLSSVHKVKVVSHCKNSNLYNNYILKEYLIYKIFNLDSRCKCNIFVKTT